MTTSAGRALGFLLLPALLLPGCGDESPTDLTEIVVGTYSLQTVNGESLPFVIFEDEGGSLEMVSGVLEMREDRTYTQTVDFETLVEGGSSDVDVAVETGMYVLDGSVIQFNAVANENSDAFSYQGFFTGNTVTYSARGIVAVYGKQ